MKWMNKNLLLLGKNNFLTNDIVTKFKQNNINYFHENKRIDKKDLYLISDLFCKKYFFHHGIKFQYILITIHFHNDLNLKNNSNVLLAKHVNYFSKKNNDAKIIYISSAQASKVNLDKYAIDKLNSEEIYIKSNNFLIIRPSTILKKMDSIIYGGFKGKTIMKVSKFIKRYNFFPIPGKGEYQHTYCTINSLSNFIIANINDEIFINEKINFFSGEYLSYKEFIKKIANYLNRNPIFFFIPVKFFKLLLSILFMKRAIKQIDNLLIEKIEYDKTDEIKRIIKLETL